MQPDGHRRASALDGLRGIAASAVIFYHTILYNDISLIDRVLYTPLQFSGNVRDAIAKVLLTVFNGEVAVYVFFVLSSCVLRLSLASRANMSIRELCIGFAGSRLLRLYPPTIVCMVFFYALSHLGILCYPVFSLHDPFLNSALITMTMHGASTTIQAEVMAIPFILIAWLLRRRFGLTALVSFFVYSIVAIEAAWSVFYLPNMHSYLFAFAAGMLVAEPGLRPLVKEAPAKSWWIALVVLVFCRMFSFHSISTLIAMVVAAAAVVGGLLHGSPGTLTTLLQRPALQAFGRVSFSLYLFNVPIIDLIFAVTDRWPWSKTHGLEAGLLTGAVSLMLTWPLAWASERWIERPSVVAGHRVWAAVRSRGRTSQSSLPA